MLKTLMELNPPALYEPGEPMFWTDPHISRQMLVAHLNGQASYQLGRIDAICGYLRQRLPLKKRNRVADLGCGPGLYSSRLADAGCRVMGMDFSPTAIGYAREMASGKEHGPEYRVGNYLQWQETACYEAAILISEDYGVLPPADRRKLLANIHEALTDNGAFVLDVASASAFEAKMQQPARNWHAVQQGFWRPHPHLVLEEHIFYEDAYVSCDQYVVCDDEVKVYRIYLMHYTPKNITSELEEAGFVVEETLSSLSGERWVEGSRQIGVICRKK